MSAINRRNNYRAPLDQGDKIQDPSVSSTANIQPRIRCIRTDCIGLYFPVPSTYFLYYSIILAKNFTSISMIICS